ncbi:hypothetical protein [Chitinophaga qingshengii]|uniref:Leucine-rich repeat domain-containing protein n=1 Tax=Chitinophaga qingshengii TaxID=1569794 RepID=A0ABR7TQ24_9BACT|nr:hypothetical protein [Chitinophaga qingshengii]MBC9931119.1 hypothetical protein [Chitinophaga qingshengii]
MKTVITDGFQITSQHGSSTKFLVLESNRLQACLNYAVKKNIKAIIINDYEDYLPDLNFLHQYDFFTEVFCAADLEDISAIYALKKLQKLSISNGKHEVDLTRFSALKECSIDWNNKIKGLDQPNNILHLEIWKFKPASKDFTILSGCTQTNILKITESNIESFKGIDAMRSLGHFEGHYLSKLTTLDGLEAIAPHLMTLILEYCRKLSNYDTVLRQLVHLKKIILGDCGPLPSIDFVRNLKELGFFSFVNTNILDGDISPADNLGYAGFDNKRHYNRKFENMKNAPW